MYNEDKLGTNKGGTHKGFIYLGNIETFYNQQGEMGEREQWLTC